MQSHKTNAHQYTLGDILHQSQGHLTVQEKDFEEELRSGDIGEVKKTADDMERSIDDVRAVHTRGLSNGKLGWRGRG
jgi:hypothetical protein